MKLFWSICFSISLLVECVAQPITNSMVLSSIDLDDNGSPELTFEVSANLQSEDPETWEVSTGLIPVGESRVLRSSDQRIDFSAGDLIGVGRVSVTNVFPRPPRPPLLSYSVSFLNYSAVYLDQWKYQLLPNSTFGQSIDVIIGFKFALSDGVHYGWLRFDRQAADDHSQFLLREFAYHPLSEESISAGQQPPLPSLVTSSSEGQIHFAWDDRWGTLILETTTNLLQQLSWEVLGESSGGPLSVAEDEELRFFRLRRP